MKKKLSKILCLVIACMLLFTACSQPASNETTAAPAETTAAPDDNGGAEPTTVEPEGEILENLNGKKIAAVVLLEDQFQRMLQITMKRVAESYGAEVLTGHSGGMLDREVELVNNYATGGVDGMCIFPVSLTGSVAALQNAANNGMQI